MKQPRSVGKAALVSLCLLLSASSSSAFLLSTFGEPLWHVSPWRAATPRFSNFNHHSQVLDIFHNMQRAADEVLGQFMEYDYPMESSYSSKARESNATDTNETRAVQLPSLQSLKLRPRFDVKETPEGFTVMAATPGLQKSDLKVEVVEQDEDAVLVISGQSSEQNKQEADHKSALALVGRFERRIRLPPTIDKSSINAKYENGILAVSLTKFEKKPLLRSTVSIE